MTKKRKKRLDGRRFHDACVRVVKEASGGYIHPQDTSWEALAYALECLCKIGHIKTDFYKRCVQLAPYFIQPSLIPKEVAPKVYSRDDKLRFYQSLAWKKLRYATLRRYGGRCQCCGEDGTSSPLRVDHIKPLSKFWELRLDPENVQVLCNDCNWGKLDLDSTDWR